MVRKITLVTYRFVLNCDTGEIETQVDNVSPEKFAQFSDELDPEWVGGKVLPKAIAYICKQLKQFDIDLEKYMQSL